MFMAEEMGKYIQVNFLKILLDATYSKGKLEKNYNNKYENSRRLIE